MKAKIRNLPSLLSGALICAAFMVIIYALKGIWPFGTGDITYNDMAQSALPIHYHIYDWLHGEKALDFDWCTGLGLNMSNSTSFTPFHLIMLFFKRENLLYCLGILVVVYIIIAAITSKYVFDKLFSNVNPLWKTLFSVMYAMSSYCVFYYTNLSWLNFVMIFPLVVYGLKLLLEDGKPVCYTLFFAYTLYLSVYQGFMVTLAVFLLSGLYLLLISPKDIRGQRTCMLGISTLVGALLSAWHSVPMAIQTLSSKRLQTSSITKENFYEKLIEKNPNENFGSKLPLAIGLQLAFVLTAILVIRLIIEKKYKKACFVFIASFFLVSPLIFESVNLLWHAGSYVGFPMRFFYITVFVLLLFSLLSISRYGDTLFIPKKKVFRGILTVSTVILAAAFVFVLYYYIRIYDGTDFISKNLALVIQAVLMVLGFLLFAVLVCQNKRITRVFCFILCLVQTFSAGYAGLANTKEKVKEKNLYNSSSYAEYCNEAAQLDLDCGVMGRIKNADTSLNTNYPFLLKTPAISNWTHNIPQYIQKSVAVLGYSTQYTRVLDSGGTVLTDGILGIKKLIQRNHHSATAQYELINSTENFSLYENKYAVEFGLLAGEELLEDITEAPLSQRFDVQNKLWKIFTNSDEELFEICTRDENSENICLVSSSDSKLVFRYTAKQDSVLYLNTGTRKKQVYKTDVNGRRISGAYYKHTTYEYFPSAAVNGLLTLGSFKAGETAEIEISCINGAVFGSDVIQLGSMPLEKMAVFGELYKDSVSNEVTEKSSLSFDYSNTAGQAKYVFIPVSYDSGWSCEVNGESAEIHKALGAYMAVELPEGEGCVTLRYRSPGTYPGILLSALGLILFAGMLLLLKKRGLTVPKFASTAVLIFFTFVFMLAVGGIYIVPSVFSVKEYIEQLISIIQGVLQ